MKTDPRLLQTLLWAALFHASPDLRAEPLINHARTGVATQSSTCCGGVPVPARAIDGNTDGHYANNSVTATGNAPDEWWEVDLGGPRVIGSIHLWMRTDCCQTHRTYLRLVVYDHADPATRQVLAMRDIDSARDQMVFDFEPSLTGGVVRIEHHSGAGLPVSLAEVQVFNQIVPSLENFALTGTATASSEGFSSTAASAINGTISANFNAAGMYVNVTALDPAPYWQVDLGATRLVGRVQVWVRTDYCLPCAAGFRVTVLDEAQAVLFQGVPAEPPTRSFGFSFGPPLAARHVRVDLDPGVPLPIPPYRILQLAEVEVLGLHPAGTAPITVLDPPEGRTITAGERATFGPVSARVDGPVLPEQISYQWLRNGAAIPGANASTYTTPYQSATNDNDRYAVRVMAPGFGMTSDEAELRVLPESVPPEVTSLRFGGGTTLTAALAFSEPIDGSLAGNPGNYSIENATVLQATPGPDGRSVILRIAGLRPFDDYRLTVRDVADLSGNGLASTHLTGTVPFHEINHAPGGHAYQSSTNAAGFPWLAIDGNTDGIFANGSVSHNRTGETGAWWELDLGEARPIGRIALWWRTDCCLERADNLTLKILDETRTPLLAETYPGRPPFPYYARNLATPFAGRYVRIEGSDPPAGRGTVTFAEVQVIAPYEQEIGIVLTTNLPPTRPVLQNKAATFRLGASAIGAPNDRLTYQWVTNGVDVPGAIGSSYTTPILTFADDGLTVQCRVSLPGLETTSGITTISISTDVVPPQVEGVTYALGDTPETVRLTIRFNEPIEYWSLGDAFNYSINDNLPLTVAAAADLLSATVTIPSPEAALGIYHLAISHLTDLVGNEIVPVRLDGVVPFTSENTALAGRAVQSSTGFGGVAERAIDGNTDQNYWNLSASNTGFPPVLDEWWEVDLGAPIQIGQIRLWLRTDCCFDHRRNLRLVVYDRNDPFVRRVQWSRELDYPQPDVVAYSFLPAVEGQVVRVEHYGDIPLPVTLAEVQVYRATPALRLTAERGGNQTILSWPAVPGLVLEANSAPGSAPWTVVEPAPDRVGDMNRLAIPTAGEARFFRLKSP